ncbi:MAG: hypothetical protein KDD63_29770, partial [Bacteroidetes bacterium]|nr:hypothetical protein [Bacteroidota bacterium]
MDSATLEKALTRANNLINSFKNDSAYNLLSPILEQLVKERRADSPMGLKVQLAAATALEHDDQDSLAMPLLLKIREISEKKALWETYTKTCIALANLHETLDQKGESLEDLRRAQSILKQNNLDNLYPGFAVRMASWHRVFGDRDSALFYAREVLRTAPAFNQILEEAIGHMLMNLLIADSSSTEALEHCFAAIKIYQQLEDYTGCSAMFNGIAKLYFRGGAFPKALHYNDSIIFYSQKSINYGYERDASLFEAYKFRADIYRELRQMDSAWFYLKEGSKLEKAFLESREHEKVIEIEARYDDEKNTQRIATQARIIQ